MIYRFVQTSPVAPLSVSVTVAVSDSAAANGFGVAQKGGAEQACPWVGCDGSPVPLDLTGTGISLIDLKIFAGTSSPIFEAQTGGPSWNGFEATCNGGGLPDCLPAWVVDVSGFQSSISVDILFYGEFDSLEFSSTHSGGTGFYTSDNPAAGDCFLEGPCNFSGAMVVVEAPTPASLGMLLTGLMGVTVVRRLRCLG